MSAEDKAGNVGNVGDTRPRFAKVKEGNVDTVGDVGDARFAGQSR